MDTRTDLTLFWLAWQKTCSIRLCCAGHEKEYREKCAANADLIENAQRVQDLASGVMASMDGRFDLLLRNRDAGARLSEFSEEARGRGAASDGGSAFELLESHLYNKRYLKGRAFKAYLFEEVAGRPGGMNRNLFGYLQRILATVVDESYGDCVYQPRMDDDGVEIEPAQVSVGGRMARETVATPAECAEAHEVEEVFRKYLVENAADWDSDHWLILFCLLNLLRVGSERIRPLFAKGHQTVNVWFSQMRSELLSRLREGFSDKAIGMALNGALQGALDEKVSKMPWYGEARKILAENRESTGK